MQPLTLLELDDDLSVFARGSPALTPAQQATADELISGTNAADVNILRVTGGMGRTTILRFVHAQLGGSFLNMRQFLRLHSKRSPKTVAQAFLETASDLMNRHQTLFIDDFHLFMQAVDPLERSTPVQGIVAALLDEAAAARKKLVFAVSDDKGGTLPLSQRGIVWEMAAFETEDYACIADYYLGNAAATLNLAKVHRFAPALTIDQIKNACFFLGFREAVPDTDSLIAYLRSR